MSENNLRFTDLCKLVYESANYISAKIQTENIELTYNEHLLLEAGIMLMVDDMEHSLDIVSANPLIIKNREHIIVSLMLIAEKVRYVDGPAFVNSFHIACLDMIQRIRDRNYT